MHYAKQTYYSRIRRDSVCNTFQEPIITSVIDVKKITAWGESGFPARFLAEGRTILWADESGFYLLPALLRTWAPVAQTPVIQRKLSYDHLSAISAISLTGDLYLAVQDHSYKGADVVGFLEQLLAAIPGKLLVIWDGAPVRRCRAAKEYLARGAARRLRLEQLPGYAPELNPDEGIWRYLKRVELKNVVCADLGHLRHEFWAAAQRLLAKPDVLRACVREVGYV